MIVFSRHWKQDSQPLPARRLSGPGLPANWDKVAKQPRRSSDLWALPLSSSSSSFSLLSPHLSPPPPPHPASISILRVPGVTKLCRDTLQLLRCLLNYGRSSEATALMKHAARSHISPWRGETCCWGVNYSDSKYHSSHHARTSDKKPPATSGLHTSPVGRTNQPINRHI